jgi:hypothetical protein
VGVLEPDRGVEAEDNTTRLPEGKVSFRKCNLDRASKAEEEGERRKLF